MSFHDVELLSAYLDGKLRAAEAARLEARLAGDQTLRALMQQLREARSLLRSLPRRKAPRNFTLRANMRNLTAPIPPAFPALRFASVLASMMFVLTLAINGLAPLAANRLAAAPAPAYGFGGGGPPAEGAMPAGTPPAQLAAAPTAPPEPNAPATAPDLQAQAQKSTPEVPRGASTAPTPVPLLWQGLLAGIAILLGLTAWYVRSDSLRRFRQRWIKQ